MKKKPTIAELEALLDGPPCTIQINPDGSLTTTDQKKHLAPEVRSDAGHLPACDGYISVLQALEASVMLQSHYAGLLNQYDGGERKQFKNAQEWILRLKEIGEISES